MSSGAPRWLLATVLLGLVFGHLLPISGEGATAPQTLSDKEKEEFLLRAEIVDRRILDVGVTGSERATLTDGEITHDAHIQTIDVYKKRFKTTRRTYVDFRDSYKYNIAAYRLDRLIGLNMVPVSVERRIDREKAAVTWWVDDVLMMEKDRWEQGLSSPDAERWNEQMFKARVFNQLVYNSDPNLGNMLITSDWKIWMIDFSRAFRTFKQLPEAEGLRKIDRSLYRGLSDLDRASLKREAGAYLTPYEIKGVLARRDKILEIFEGKIAEQGEAVVVYELAED
jgi:hypothetical protein